MPLKTSLEYLKRRFLAIFSQKTLPKLCQKHPKIHKMKNQKLLSEHQNSRLFTAPECPSSITKKAFQCKLEGFFLLKGWLSKALQICLTHLTNFIYSLLKLQLVINILSNYPPYFHTSFARNTVMDTCI
ncbi:putative Fe-S radical SAM superfamily protein PflX [Mucilaginibacter lappiensis]